LGGLAEAILEVYGNIKLEWKNWDSDKQSYECWLETGEIFKPSDIYDNKILEDEEKV